MAVRKRFAHCKSCDDFIQMTDDRKCPGCGHHFEEAIKQRDPVAFRPHFSYSLGRHVDSQADMQKAADEMNKKHGYNVVMRRA